MAQEAVVVLKSSETGTPTYNPIKGTKVNLGRQSDFDRMVVARC